MEDIFVHDRETEKTFRVSVDSEGNEANLRSFSPLISADGHHVVFVSFANNLVPDDTNGYIDIFMHELETGITVRVNVDSDGNEANKDSMSPSVSENGRYVAFTSWASNLIHEDTNDDFDIFVHDRETGNTSRVSVDSAGNESNDRSDFATISANNRYIAFHSDASNLVSDDTNGKVDIFVHDLETGDTTRVSINSEGDEGNGGSLCPSISSSGRYVTFESYSDNLVSDDNNELSDIFVHDRETNNTIRVNVDADGNEANYFTHSMCSRSISADGRLITFDSMADNLVSNDTNEYIDAFVHNQVIGDTIRVSVDSNGNEGDCFSYSPSISADGRYVAFVSCAANLVPEDVSGYEIFVHGPLTVEPIEVTIDIAPKRYPNRIRPEHGNLSVAIMKDETFDATQVDLDSIGFGSEVALPWRSLTRDVDSDGDIDLVLYFKTEETGIECGDTEATLTGETTEGESFSGTDSIITIGCQRSGD